MQIDFLSPLTDEEVEDLDALLASDRVSPDAMTLPEMDGFITGIVAGPVELQPNEWVPLIFGEALPPWENDDEAAKFGATIMRRSIQISAGLNQDPPRVALWLDQDAEGNVDPVGWANGFLQAIAQEQERWLPMMKDPHGSVLVLPIVAFANPEPDEEDEGDDADDDLPLNDAEAEEVLAVLREEIGGDIEHVLSECVVNIYGYWRHAEAHANAPASKKKRVRREPPHRRK